MRCALTLLLLCAAACGDDGSTSEWIGTEGDGGPSAGDGDGDGNGDGDGDGDAAGDGDGDSGDDAGASVGDGDGDGDATGPMFDADGCPTGKGPDMVRIADHCVDSTEVTQAQYLAFLDSGPDLYGQPESCQFYGSFRPSNAGGCADVFDPAQLGDHPVTCVNWCSGQAFCAWAGKRLCGATGGGTNEGARDDAAQSQWYDACSMGGATAWVYGDARVAGTCNDNSPSDGTTAVGSLPGCEGGHAGLFDMNDNVAEWTDECPLGVDPADDNCAARGGAHDNNSKACDHEQSEKRGYRGNDVGFRCCGEAQ